MYVRIVCIYMSQATQPETVSERTSISVSTTLADELYDRKKRGESYEDVIWRLIEKADASEDDR